MRRAAIEVKESPVHRYGVFAIKPIKAGETIEECPVLVVNKDATYLERYWFKWQNKDHAAIALGWGTIYNHSKNPNAEAELDYQRELITFKAEKFIAAGEEIFISYGDTWFEERGLKEVLPVSRKKEILLGICKVLTIIGAIFLIKLVLK